MAFGSLSLPHGGAGVNWVYWGLKNNPSAISLSSLLNMNKIDKRKLLSGRIPQY